MVTKITEGSPASDAGLQLNDIITAVDGQKVSSFETLRSALSYYAAGESVTITVQRPNGNQYTETQITVTLADRSTITDTTEADTEEGSSEAETQEPQVQMQKAHVNLCLTLAHQLKRLVCLFVCVQISRQMVRVQCIRNLNVT